MWKYEFFKIEPSHVESFLRWGKKLMGKYKDEALKTMKQENVIMEMMYLIPKETGYIILGAVLFYGEQMPMDMNNSLNVEDRKIKDRVLKKIEPVELKGYALQAKKFVVPENVIVIYELGN